MQVADSAKGIAGGTDESVVSHVRRLISTADVHAGPAQGQGEVCLWGGGRVMFILTLGILYFDSTRVLVIQIQRFYDFMKA